VASLLLRGFALGFAIAATPGPMFFLCLRRALRRGWPDAFVSGLGVATADGLYGAAAALGVAAVTSALLGQRRWLALIGGAALLALGVRTLMRGRASQEPAPGSPSTASSLSAAYLSTFGLTITNPTTILSFAAVFAGLGLSVSGGFQPAAWLVAGVVSGSAAWWLVLATAAVLLRRQVTPAAVQAISALSGVAIVAFGVLAIVSAFGSR
jgi:threonine/homoserine/homoserine lactone efflux protein